MVLDIFSKLDATQIATFSQEAIDVTNLTDDTNIWQFVHWVIANELTAQSI